jgi:hypothetical protein
MQQSKGPPRDPEAGLLKGAGKNDAIAVNENQVDAPSSDDILLGRGRPFQSHPGNQRMLRLVNERKEEYQQLPRDKKRPLVEELLMTLCDGGGRFLKRAEDQDGKTFWAEVSHDVAFEKVCHALRTKNRKPARHPSPKPDQSEPMLHLASSSSLGLPAVRQIPPMIGSTGIGLPPLNRGLLNLPLSANFPRYGVDLSSLCFGGTPDPVSSLGISPASDPLYRYAAGLPRNLGGSILGAPPAYYHDTGLDQLARRPQLFNSSIYEDAATLTRSQLLQSLLQNRRQDLELQRRNKLRRGFPPFI